jgi:DNA-binding Lrp family transcriptional regulator
MVIGVTMVNVSPGSERDVYVKLKRMKNVREIYHVFGEFDFVVIIQTDTLSGLNKTVDEIRSVTGVTKTQTVVGAEIGV